MPVLMIDSTGTSINPKNYISIQYVAGDPVGDSYSNPYTMNDIITASDAGSRVVSSTLNSGGSGYAANDIFIIDSPGNASAWCKVLTVDGSGAILTYEVLEGVEGDGYSIATGLTTTTKTGSGTGATIDVTAVGPWRCSNIGSNYYIPYPLNFIGTLTVQTYFYDYGKNVELYINWNNIPQNGVGMYINSYVYFKSGLFNANVSLFYSMTWSFTNNSGRNANWQSHLYSAPSEVLYYVTTFNGIYAVSETASITGTSIGYNLCNFYNCRIVIDGTGDNISWENITIGNTLSWIYQYGGLGTVDNVTIYSSAKPIFRNTASTNYNVTTRNLKIVGATAGQQFAMTLRTNSTWNFVDCGILKSNSLVGWQNITANSDISVNLLSTFKFNLDSNTVGGNLTLYDKDDNVVLDQAITTEVFEEEVMYFQFRGVVDAGGSQSDIITDREPFKLKISNDCCETLLMENIVINTGNPTNINASLKTQVPIMISPDNAYVKKNPENYGANRDLLV